MPPLLGKARIIDDPSFDLSVPFNARQHYLTNLGQHLLIRPVALTDKMQQRLMLRCCPLRSRHRRHRLDTLPIARHHQPSAVIAKRFGPSRMSDHACKTINICRKSRRYVSRFCQTHLSLPMLKSESSQLYDSCRQTLRHSDSVRLEHDVIRWNRHHALALCLNMISAQTRSAFVARENRFPLFRIMLSRAFSSEVGTGSREENASSQMAKWQRSAGLDRLNGDVASHFPNNRHVQERADKEALIVREIGHHDFQKIVRLARYQMAGNHLRQRADRFLECQSALVGVTVDLHADKDRESEADPLPTERGPITDDVAVALQTLHAPQTGRG